MNDQTKLIEGLKTLHRLRNDAALARKLQVAPPVISKLRHGILTIGDAFLVKIHDTFDMPIKQIRALYQEPDSAVLAP